VTAFPHPKAPKYPPTRIAVSCVLGKTWVSFPGSKLLEVEDKTEK